MLVTNLAILVLAGFVGFYVISKVPNTLHTPLMSGTNAIHGIVIVGGLLVLGLSGDGTFNKVILFIAIAFGVAPGRTERRGNDHSCACLHQALHRWDQTADGQVVDDLASLVDGDVEIAAQEHALVLDFDVVEGGETRQEWDVRLGIRNRHGKTRARSRAQAMKEPSLRNRW